MKKRSLIAILLGCWGMMASAQTNTSFEWITVEQSEPVTKIVLDRYYRPQPYYGSECHAGIIESSAMVFCGMVPEDFDGLEDCSRRDTYIDMYGNVIVDNLEDSVLVVFSDAAKSFENFETKISASISVNRGGRYTYHCMLPGIGYDNSRVMDVVDSPSVRISGSSVTVGNAIDVRVHFNTGYPYDVNQFNGKERAQIFLMAEGSDAPIGSAEHSLKLYRPDQPLIAAVDTVALRSENLAPGVYNVLLKSDWVFEGANSTFAVAVNDTLRAKASLDKERYSANDKEARLTVTADYRYPHIAVADGKEKPEVSIAWTLTDTYETDGITKEEILGQDVMVYADDSLATQDLNEVFDLRIPLAEIGASRKSADERPLSLKVDVRFNGVTHFTDTIPFYCDGATAISLVKAAHADGRVYDLQGRRISGSSGTNGIYIRDGKKFAVCNGRCEK